MNDNDNDDEREHRCFECDSLTGPTGDGLCDTCVVNGIEHSSCLDYEYDRCEDL